MGPLSGTSEIVEANKDMNTIHSSKGLNLNTVNSKSRVADIVAKHLLPILAQDCSMETDLNQLFEAMDLRNPSRGTRPANQSSAVSLRKNTLKKPIRVGISQASGIGVAESGTLKQALRGLCISQASEMATLKRLSKPAGLSGVSEAGTIKKLYRTVVVQAGESGPSSDEGNVVGSNPGNFMEISLVPGSGTSDLLEQKPESLQPAKVDLSNQKAVSPHSCAVLPTPEIVKTKTHTTLSQDERAPVLREAVNKSSKLNLRVKVKTNSAPSISGSPGTGCEVIKSDVGNRENRMICKNKKCSKRKGQQESPSLSSSSNMCSDIDSGVSDPSSSILDSRYRTLGVKTSESSRSREKGECSYSSKSSIGEYSSSSGLSGESNLSGSSCNGSRPHMSKDSRWEAIHQVEMEKGSLGLKHFNLLRRLGCGDIGNVYLAALSDTKCQFALKVMDSEFLESRKKMPRAQTEKEILQMLDHPFLPTLYAHFTTDKFSCLVMEYCPGGDLHFLRQRQPGRSFSEQAARFYATEVLLALEYLHMLGVVYRDLKPENVLVREDGHIMLSDFDLSLRCSVNPTLVKSSSSGIRSAKKLSGICSETSCINPPCLQPWVPMACFTPRLISPKVRKPKSDRSTPVRPLPELVAEPVEARSNSFVGTHEYLAPEIIRGEGHGSAVDWWTFGIFLYELLFGKTPFKGLGNDDTLANVVSQCLKFPESPAVSFPARDLIRGLLIKEPENRLGSLKGAVEIKQHPFFEGLNWALVRCATPPETPKVADEVRNPAGTCQKKESNCLEFRSAGEDIEFELF